MWFSIPPPKEEFKGNVRLVVINNRQVPIFFNAKKVDYVKQQKSYTLWETFSDLGVDAIFIEVNEYFSFDFHGNNIVSPLLQQPFLWHRWT